MTPAVRRERDLKWLPLDKIIPNEHNPRGKTPLRSKPFSPEELSTLRDSVREHGILQPVVVEPYKDDMYVLVDGERRYTTAKIEGLTEIPAVIINRLNVRDELVVMYNIHANQRGWEKAEELLAIKKLIEQNGHKSEADMARELSISLSTFRERMRVLGMGEKVVAEIAKGSIDYSSAMRVDQITQSLARKRPELVEKLGGVKAVEKDLLRKAKVRGGISQELVEIRRDLTEVDNVPDAAVEEYVKKPEATKRDLRKRTATLEERRKVEGLSKELRKVTTEIRRFNVKLADAPNLRELRGALVAMMDAAQVLEERVVEAILTKSESDR
jgi:ParB/RepB/Spo0J family partition protein